MAGGAIVVDKVLMRVFCFRNGSVDEKWKLECVSDDQRGEDVILDEGRSLNH